MRKRIIICADGTWNRPEKNVEKDVPSNVLKLARAIQPVANDGIPQQVFYDWGIGSYNNALFEGLTGFGINKNILDNYRYIVQNYAEGDELFFFGFSRGAYTVRCLSGLIYNCGIIKRPFANKIQDAYRLYKCPDVDCMPNGNQAKSFRESYSYTCRDIHFVGAWDTVGALGIPFSFLGLFDENDVFYDTKLGPNIKTARHALALDELRKDFEPTLWRARPNSDIKQCWFSGCHLDIGGGYPCDKHGLSASQAPLEWMVQEACAAGLSVEPHLLTEQVRARLPSINDSRSLYYRFKKDYWRSLFYAHSDVLIHRSVKQRWENDKEYRPNNLHAYLESQGWGNSVI